MNALWLFLAGVWLGAAVGFVVAALLGGRDVDRDRRPNDPDEDPAVPSDNIPAFPKRKTD